MDEDDPRLAALTDESDGMVEAFTVMTRLGGLAVVVTGLLFGALHLWPPVHTP